MADERNEVVTDEATAPVDSAEEVLTEETPVEEPLAEESPAEEAPVEPVAEEAPAEEVLAEPVAEETPAEETPTEETPVETAPAKKEPAEKKPFLARLDAWLTTATKSKWGVIVNKTAGLAAILCLLVASYLGIAGFWFDAAFVFFILATVASGVAFLFAAASLYLARGKGKGKRRARKKALRIVLFFAVLLIFCALQFRFSQIPHRDGRYGGFWHQYDGIYYDVLTEEDGKVLKICDADVDAKIVCIPKEVRGIPVKYVYGIAFANCENLTEFVVSSTHKYYSQSNGVLYTADATTLICYPRGAGSLSHTFTAPSGTKTIAAYAFRNNRFLTNISLPGVEVIEEGAFSNAASLTNITFSENLTTISHNAFAGCTSLRTLEIPASVTFVGNGAFSGFSATQSILICASAEYEAQWSESWKRDCDAVIDRT